MELHDDNSAVKDRILEDIGKAIKLLHQQVQREAGRRAPCPASASLLSLLDAGLRHGLRDPRPGYWPLVAAVSHSETRRALAGVASPAARGKAWVQLAVSEGSLRSHLECAACDREALARHYGDRALLRDHARAQLLLRLAGAADAVAGGLLRQEPELQLKQSEAECGKGAAGPDPLMMASVTSSLGSPVDSGVALLDSDSEATTANGEPDDGSSLREVEAAFHDTEGTTPTPSVACPPPPVAVVGSCDSAETPVGSEGSCEAFVCPHGDPTSVQDAVERQVLGEIARRFRESNSPRRKHARRERLIQVAKRVAPFVPGVTGDDCKGKFNSLRSHYGSQIKLIQCSEKSGCSPEDVYKPSVWWFKSMDFIKDHINPRKSRSNVELRPFQSQSLSCEGTQSSLDLFESQEVTSLVSAGSPVPAEIVGAELLKEPAPVNVDNSTKPGTNHPADTNKMNEPIITMCNEKKYEMEEKSELANKEASAMCDSEAKNNEKNRIYHSPDNKQLEAAGGDSDGIVFRRHRRRRKANGDPATPKRVSFHGDVGAAHPQGQQFSASFMPAHPVVKKDVVPGRYSWCAEGDAPFVERRDGGAGGTRSDVLLASSTSSVATTDTAGADSARDAEVGASTDSLEVSEERGIPEGREDPPRTDRGGGALMAAADDSAIAAAAAAAGSRGGCFVLSASLAKFASVASSMDYWSSDEADGDDSAVADKRRSVLSAASSAPSLKARISQRRLTALSQKPSKAPLLQRFMRSLAGSAPRRPPAQWRRGQPGSAPASPFPRLPCPVPAPPARPADSPERAVALAAAEATFAAEMRQLAAQKISAAAAEADCGPPGDVELDREIAQKAFSATVFCRPTETLYKVYKVSSSYWSADGAGPRPLLLLLTDWGVYVCGLRANLTYCAVLALAYRDLHTVIAGPRLQTLILVPDPVTHPLPPLALATPDGDCARSLLCHLDVAARRAHAPQKAPGARLPAPAVAQVAADDMARLKAQLDVEEVVHYALVRVQDEQLSPPSTPLGPQRHGHLMARAAHDRPWRPAFFILKAGVLYQFADQSQRLPQRALLLGGGHCLGARRLPAARARPHAFELCTAGEGEGGGRRLLQMAAADEYEASEWLQALVQAASGLFEVERAETVPCSVLLTRTAVVTCREHWWPRWVGAGSPGGGAEGRRGRAETLARAPLADVTSVTVATDSDSWCILEFSCREVHATSGDWVLYFASPREMVAFREALRALWPSVSKREFPLRSRLEEGVHRRCVETALTLAAAWDQLLPPPSLPPPLLG